MNINEPFALTKRIKKDTLLARSFPFLRVCFPLRLQVWLKEYETVQPLGA